MKKICGKKQCEFMADIGMEICVGTHTNNNQQNRHPS